MTTPAKNSNAHGDKNNGREAALRSRPKNLNNRKPDGSDELTKRNIDSVMDIEDSAKKNRSVSERIAEVIANFCGSMIFVWVHVAWFGAWIIINSMMTRPWDPFPFTFLTLVVSLEAIFLSTFILINQERETAITEERNHLDLQVNLLAEQENTKMLQMLLLIAEKLDVEIEDDPQLEEMMTDTQPEKVVSQIGTKKGTARHDKLPAEKEE